MFTNQLTFLSPNLINCHQKIKSIFNHQIKFHTPLKASQKVSLFIRVSWLGWTYLKTLKLIFWPELKARVKKGIVLIKLEKHVDPSEAKNGKNEEKK